MNNYSGVENLDYHKRCEYVEASIENFIRGEGDFTSEDRMALEIHIYLCNKCNEKFKVKYFDFAFGIPA